MKQLTVLLALLLAFQGAPRLVIMGDSISASGGGGATTLDKSFPVLVATRLGMPLDYRAIAGSMIAEQEVPTDLHPGDVVLWLTGFNDVRHGNDPVAYGALLRAAVAQMRDQGAAVYLAGCLPMPEAGYATYPPDWNHGSLALCEEYTEQIRAVPGAVFVPLHYDTANVNADLSHPNDAGHAQIAASFLVAMQRRVVLNPPPFSAVWQRPHVVRLAWTQPQGVRATCLFREPPGSGDILIACWADLPSGQTGLTLGTQGPMDGAFRAQAGDTFVLVQDGAVSRAELRGVVYLASVRR